MDTQGLKKVGEEAAAKCLISRGLRVLSSNYRTKFGEIDIVAMDGSTLVFVEVKARFSDRFCDPALAVDYRKQRKLRRLAEAYLVLERPSFVGCRFDVVSVVADLQGLRVTHIPSAF